MARDVYGADIWVIRISFTEDNEIYLNSSKPCKSCILALKQYHINRIFYSTQDGNIKCEKIRDINDEYITSFQKHTLGKIKKWSLI